MKSASLIFTIGVKMKNMRVKFLVIFCLFVSIPGFAQEVEKDTLSFVRNTSFDFYFVNAYAVGYKFSVDENSSLKFILDFDGSYLNKNTSVTDRNLNIEEWRDNINFNLYAFYLYSLYKNNYIDISLGFGPYYNLNYYSNKEVDIGSNVSRYYNSSHYHALGGSVAFGVEGFITSRISLIAETYLTGSHRWENQFGEYTQNAQGVEIYRSSNTGSSTSWFWEINFARLGIGIYF